MNSRGPWIALFWVFGFLPTAALAVWGGVRSSPWYVERYGTRVEEFVGLPVELESVAHPRPDKTRLTGLRLYLPPETGSSERLLLADVPELEIWTHDIGKPGRAVTQSSWTVPEMSLDATCLEPLWVLHKRVLARGEYWRRHELALNVEGTVRVGSEPTLEIQNAQLRIFYGNFGPQTDIQFKMPDGGEMALVRLSLQQVRQNHSTVVVLTLDTGERGLSTQRLAGLFPMLERFGTRCRFRGTILIQESFSRWSGIFKNGTFSDVDLATLFPNHSPTREPSERTTPSGPGTFLVPARLAGIATLSVERVRFDGSQLTQAVGAFSAQNGAISRAFLDDLLSVTGLSTRAIPLDATDPLPFREFAFSFRMQAPNVQITGACTGHGPGVFLTNAHGPVLCEPTRSRKPISVPILMQALR